MNLGFRRIIRCETSGHRHELLTNFPLLREFDRLFELIVLGSTTPIDANNPIVSLESEGLGQIGAYAKLFEE